MEMNEESNVFDILAYLCSLFTKEKERECAERWVTAECEEIQMVLEKYKNLFATVLNASVSEYKFSNDEIMCLNSYLDEINENYEGGKLKFDEIYLLAIELEHYIDRFSDWQGKGVIFQMDPLNTNYETTGISIYPHYLPAWNTDKSERKRSRTFNARFENYIMIRKGDVSPFEIIMYYWNDAGLLEKDEDGWSLKVALSPVMEDAEIDKKEVDGKYGKGVLVNGIKNETEVTERVIRIFDAAFEKQYGIIVFPEVLGNENIVSIIKAKMREHPEICTYVLLPTICGGEKNVLVVLGPGGIEMFRRDKGTSFILQDENGESYKEQLQYKNQIELLITQELGNIAFPICAELLEPLYYSKMIEEGHADFIISPSFSPGYQAFEKTLKKGEAAMTLGLWVNCCSAGGISRNGKVPETLAAVQLPYTNDENCVRKIKPECNGNCGDEVCYFDVTIIYRRQMFYVQFEHCMCA